MDLLSPIRAIFEFMLPFLDSLLVVRPILALLIVFFLPGFTWTLVFFSGRQISILERLALSLGLSIAVVTLSILTLNRLIGVSITGINSVLTIASITIIPAIWYSLKRFMRRRRGNAT